MNIYETVVILDSLLTPKEIDDSVEHYSKVITDHGGKVRQVEKWGKRRLAYEIQKKQYGFYFAIEFEDNGEIPSVLQNEFNYNDNVLRYLTYRYDKHKLMAIEKDQPKVKVHGETYEPEPAKEKPVAVTKEEDPKDKEKKNENEEA